MRINQEIRNLIAGISQQPPMTRHPEQVEEQINGLASEVNGLQKRPPSLFVSKINEDLPTTSKVHFIDRDKNEQYIVVFTGTGIKIWDTDGNPKVVKHEGNTLEYLKVQDPRTDIKVITIADHSIIVNTKKVTRMKPTNRGSEWDNQGLLIFIRSGAFSRTYSVDLDGVRRATYMTPDGQDPSHAATITPTAIALNLYAPLSAYWASYSNQNWILVPKTHWNTYKVWDGFNGETISAIHKEVKKLSDLPVTAPEGFTVKIIGENSTNDDYYIKFTKGSWKETVCPGLQNEIDETTMPITLRRNEDGSFTTKVIDWDSRTVGDEDSNPIPSFIGEPIHDVFFYRNRLGLIAGEGVNLSASNDYFNYWVSSATDIIDTDPIDLRVSHNRISTLTHAVPFNQDLYLFSNNTQFIIQSDGILSPKNVHIDQATEYESSPKVRPIGVGKNLYFVSERLEYSTVNEYTATLDETRSRECQDITSHCPSLVRNSIHTAIANPNEHLMMFIGNSDKNTMYVYKYLILNNQKVQSAWCKWVFDGDLLGATFMGSTIYMLLKRGTHTYIEKIQITYKTEDFVSEPYRVMLDRKRMITNPKSCRYDKDTGVFEMDVPDDLIGAQKVTMVLTNGLVFKAKDNKFTIHNQGDLSKATMFIGVPYDFLTVLSTLYVKESEQGITSRVPTYRLNIDRLKVYYSDTGQLDVTVNRYNTRATGRTVGIKTNVVDNHPITTGVLDVPVYMQNTSAKITISNNTPLPSAVTNILWSGNMIQRGRSV